MTTAKLVPTIAAIAAIAALGTGLAVAGGASAEPSHDNGLRAGAGSGCKQPGPYELPRGSEPVTLDPDDFTTKIDHPYWPMRPGTVWHYVERGGGEVQTVAVKVTNKTRMIEGIKARVVHDTVRNEDGQLVENTWDWFAQDSGGNLWYLGEFSREYEDGVPVNTAGSWEHGVDGGQAGVILPANPGVDCGYREEYLEGEAEDQARVLSTRESLRTPTGFHKEVLHTFNTTPLHPDILENKFYAKGVGPILELGLSPDLGRGVLVKVTRSN